jgi:hypothetical protein
VCLYVCLSVCLCLSDERGKRDEAVSDTVDLSGVSLCVCGERERERVGAMASASTVAAAVHALYYDPDPAIKKQAEV